MMLAAPVGCDAPESGDPEIAPLESLDFNPQALGKADVVQQTEFRIDADEDTPAFGDIFLALPSDVECTQSFHSSHETHNLGRELTLTRVFDENAKQIPLTSPAVFRTDLGRGVVFGSLFESCSDVQDKLDESDVLVGFWTGCAQVACDSPDDPKARHHFDVYFHTLD